MPSEPFCRVGCFLDLYRQPVGCHDGGRALRPLYRAYVGALVEAHRGKAGQEAGRVNAPSR
jgi:hypothetical protein